MVSNSFKSLLVAVFSLICLLFSTGLPAQGNEAPGGKKEAPRLEPSKIILEHVADAHDFHLFTFSKRPVSIPLPVILYSPAKGWSVFMSSRFNHGE
ncbi:MAG TPA: F0F1 ATP synthase subunit A, partial [Puia sp.]